jgi:hypothetical protein
LGFCSEDGGSLETLVSNKLHGITSQKTVTSTYQFICTLRKRFQGFWVLKYSTVDTRDDKLVGQGPIPRREKSFFSSPQSPDRLWGPPSLLFHGYWGLFPWKWSGQCMKLTNHLHSLPTSRMVEIHLHSPICLHGVVLN